MEKHTYQVNTESEALELAKKLLCPYDFGKNCGRCAGCDLADMGQHPDIFLHGEASDSFHVKAENIVAKEEEVPLPTEDRPYQVLISAVDLDKARYSILCRKY